MRKSLTITLSLLRIRRLFFSLVLLPLLISVIVVAVQVLVSSLFVQLAQKSDGKVEPTSEPAMKFLRSVTLGQSTPLPDPIICRWRSVVDEGGNISEEPPSEECAPDRLDAAIRTDQPELFDVSDYQSLLSGSVQRIHLCQSCQPDLLFFSTPSERHVEMRGIWSVLLSQLIARNESVTDAIKVVRVTNDRFDTLVGKRVFIAHGFGAPINLSDIRSTLLLIFNFAGIIVVALWLALKAHRKVLDYFSRNGALLPMVAANGKDNFYGAIWIITLVRVFAFLLSAVPLTVISIYEFIFDESSKQLLSTNISLTALWACAFIVSLSLATLIASIADLKHRSSLVHLCYRFLPLLLAFLGAVVWGFSFIFDGASASLLRTIVCMLPVIGMVPLFVSIIFQPYPFALFVHFALSVLVIRYLLKDNARWFAAHLEEI